jgi:hypothetical protein
MLWLDFPSVGGPSPDIPVKMEVDNPNYIRRHSSFLPDCKILPWVAVSAITGLKSLQITLSKEKMVNTKYSIRFYFVELEDKKNGERVFDIHVQGEPFLINFDIVHEAGGSNRDIVKTISDVKVEDILKIQFTPSQLSPKCQTILSGIEILSEDSESNLEGRL